MRSCVLKFSAGQLHVELVVKSFSECLNGLGAQELKLCAVKISECLELPQM